MDLNGEHEDKVIDPAVMTVLIYIFVGMPIILLTAAINNIPDTLYEAADIDGATGMQKLINITLPLIKPTTFYLVVILTISAFRAFIYIKLLTGGGPYYSSSVISSHLVETAFSFNRFGLASAMGVILLLIIAVLTFVQFKFLKSDIQY